MKKPAKTSRGRGVPRSGEARGAVARAWAVVMKRKSLRTNIDGAYLWKTRAEAARELRDIFDEYVWEIREVEVRLLARESRGNE